MRRNMRRNRKLLVITTSAILAMSVGTTALAANAQGAFSQPRFSFDYNLSDWMEGLGNLNEWWNRGDNKEEEKEEQKPEQPEIPEEETQGKSDYGVPEMTLTSNIIKQSSRVMTISWNADPDCTEKVKKWIVRKASNPEFENASETEMAGGTTSYKYNILGVSGIYYHPAHCAYYFSVKAVYENGESSWSETLTAPGGN